jgi:hypothetical protein
MPRSGFSNLKRRGAAYWWRRTVSLVGLAFSEKFSISCEFSLLTKEPDLARGRSAAMTAHSERLKMSLRKQVAEHGLNQETAAKIFIEEMRAYRNELVHLEAFWKAHPVYSTISSRDDDLAMFEKLWAGIAADGLGVPRNREFIERHFARFDEEMRARIHFLLRDHPDLPDTVRKAAMQRLEEQGLVANAFNIPLASELVLKARAAAAQAVRERNHLIDPDALAKAIVKDLMLAPAPTEPAASSLATAAAAPPPPPPQPVQAEPVRVTPKKRPSSKLSDEQARFAAMSPTEFAAEFIKDRYEGLEHRAGSKRPKRMVGDSTIRDLKWAALLLEKAIPPGLPFSKVTYEHYVALDGWFDRLPVTIGKSPWDRDPKVTLRMIEEKAIARLEAGEIEADQIGLTSNTTNKHWHNIRRMQKHLCSLVPGLSEIDTSKFITPESPFENCING